MSDLFANALTEMCNLTETANGAITNKSSLDSVLDLFSIIGNAIPENSNIKNLFNKAKDVNPELTLKLLFYTRDVRGGLGRREIFRQFLNVYLHDKILEDYFKDKSSDLKIEYYKNLIDLIVEVGRYDDLINILLISNDILFNELAVSKINYQMYKDLDDESDSISLLGKWMPSINSKNSSTIIKAKSLAKHLKIDRYKYQRITSKLRAKLRIVERNLSQKNYSEINYSHIPSKAMLKYRNTFKKYDSERFEKYIEDVKAGKKDIKSNVTYPYELIKTMFGDYGYFKPEKDPVITELWKKMVLNYKDKFDIMNGNNIAVCDISGSMFSEICGGSVMPIYVSISLSILIAELNSNSTFGGKFLTFSRHPELITIDPDKDIYSKVERVIAEDNVGYNTDINAVFNLILKTAKTYNIPKDEMVKNIFLISDMEFDEGCEGRYTLTTHNNIKNKFNSEGYDLPNIIYWNVNGEYGKNYPVVKDEPRAKMISGFSPNVFESMTCSDFENISPYDYMLEVLNSDRYSCLTFPDVK